MNRYLNKEQQKGKLKEIEQDLRSKGLYPVKNSHIRRREEVDKQYTSQVQYSKDKLCIVCRKPLSETQANVCSGTCMIERDNNFNLYKHNLK